MFNLKKMWRENLKVFKNQDLLYFSKVVDVFCI